jgi:hypothetical protein
VVFEKPAESVVKKWQLACVGNIAHVVVMPSVDRKKLQDFFDDYMASRKVCVCVCLSVSFCLCLSVSVSLPV